MVVVRNYRSVEQILVEYIHILTMFINVYLANNKAKIDQNIKKKHLLY